MGGPEAVRGSTEVGSVPSDLADVDQENGSGGKSTDLTREPSVVSPLLIAAPDSPPLSAQLPPNSEVAEKGPASSSLDRNCAPSQAPVAGTADYDELSYGHLHELCTQRSYHGLDTRVVIRCGYRSNGDTELPWVGYQGRIPWLPIQRSFPLA